jgi:hypothetical protein
MQNRWVGTRHDPYRCYLVKRYASRGENYFLLNNWVEMVGVWRKIMLYGEKQRSGRQRCQFCARPTYARCPECCVACCLVCGANICPICVRIQLYQNDHALSSRVVSWQHVELVMLPWPRALHFVGVPCTPFRPQATMHA